MTTATYTATLNGDGLGLSNAFGSGYLTVNGLGKLIWNGNVLAYDAPV
jgi:hypothetical protein